MKHALFLVLFVAACGQPHAWPTKSPEALAQGGDARLNGDSDAAADNDLQADNSTTDSDSSGITPGDSDSNNNNPGDTDSTNDSVQCEPCASDDDCGDGYSAGCWLGDDFDAYCAYDCTEDEDACPSGSYCDYDFDFGYGTCLPNGGLCEGQSDSGGDISTQCMVCFDDSDCGDGISAGCWLEDSSDAYCALDCTYDLGACPTGYYCDHDGIWGACMPNSGYCE